MTRPTVWNVPRSLSLVTVAGLMSTQTTLTHAGSRLPVAIECRAVAIIRAKPTSRTDSRISAWAWTASVMTSGKRAVVADRAGEDDVDAVLDALVHDPRA